ncbi:hypothetical protein DVH05_005826 [Phytophthora capsici]|nr:hypothetical protein DVH05_005826 [Phytophthora capsici]
MQATHAGKNYDQSAFQRLGSDGDGGSSVGDATLTPVEKQEEKDNLTIQPITEDSSDSSFPTTSIIIIAVGSVIFLSLAFCLAVFRRERTSSDQNDSYNYPPENSRFCMKRTTFAVKDASRTGFEEIDSSGSVVPVLGGNISLGKCKKALRWSLSPPELRLALLQARTVSLRSAVDIQDRHRLCGFTRHLEAWIWGQPRS